MRAVDDLEHAEELDGLVGLGQRWARLLRPGRCRDALYGVWLGHPLHPLLAQAPIGLWLSATVLDAWPGDGERAARRLVLTGLAAVVPAALAGTVDWSEQHEQQMRVGTVHAMANGAAGGKLIGAGGGGFLMFYATDRTRLRHTLRQAGLQEVRFRFDFEGTRLVSV